MLLNELFGSINESWQNKFASKHGEIKNMTLFDFGEYVRQEYDYRFKLNRLPSRVGAGPNTDYIAKGASINTKYSTLTVNIQGDVDQDTRCGDIDGFVSTIRHELSHIETPDSKRMELGYTGTDAKDIDSWARYVLQPMERSQQVLTMIDYMSPHMDGARFKEIVKQAAAKIRSDGGINQEVAGSVKSQLSGIESDREQIRITNSVLAVAYGLTLGEEKLKAQSKYYLRQMLKQWKSGAGQREELSR